MQQMIFTQISVSCQMDELKPSFKVIDISNYNLGIFLYLIDNSPDYKLILDMQNKSLESISSVDIDLSSYSMCQPYQSNTIYLIKSLNKVKVI